MVVSAEKQRFCWQLIEFEQWQQINTDFPLRGERNRIVFSLRIARQKAKTEKKCGQEQSFLLNNHLFDS
jgi:hypothetical protein